MGLTKQEKQALIDLANTARQRAYAPYSHYTVGSSLRTKTGRIYTGVNVENAAGTKLFQRRFRGMKGMFSTVSVPSLCATGVFGFRCRSFFTLDRIR